MSIKLVMPSNHLILCRPLLLLPSVFPSIRVFSSELALRIRWPKYWSFSFSISPSNECSGLISFRIDWFDLLAFHGFFKSNTTVQKHQFFSTQLTLWSNSHWKSVFISIPKKGNAKECSNCTIALISHASKVMIKILQARIQ